MNSNKLAKVLVAACATVGVLWSGMAFAIDWNITGFIRQEIGVSVTAQENQNNQMSDDQNGLIVPHYTSPAISTANAALPKNRINSAFTFFNGGALAPRSGTAFDNQTLPAGTNTAASHNCRFGNRNRREAFGIGSDPIGAIGLFGSEGFFGTSCPSAGGGFAATSAPGYTPAGFSAQGVAGQDDFDVTLFNTRAEVDVQAKISRSFGAYAKFRTYFWSEDTFTNGRVGDHFTQKGMFHGDSGNILEASTADFLFDIPALYIDYNKGPLWIRVGQQTIAWGEAYFFRIMDVANGLDLRRHFIDVAAEEFSDQRVASPAIRVSYTFNNSWEIDAFAQMFSPTLLPGSNTPYSVVGHGVTLDEEDEFEEAENAINFGFRLTAPVTDNLTLLGMYTNRRDPNGVFRYAEAPRVWSGQVNPFCLGPRNDTFQLLNVIGGAFGHNYNPMTAADPTGGTAKLGITPADGSCGSPLAPDAWAVNSTEFVNKTAEARLDPVKAIGVVVDEWEADRLATREAFGFATERNLVDAISTAEGFHSSFGAFRAWVTREFPREQIFAFGGNYIVNSENEWLDQLIIRGEVAITPDKKFTDLGLSRHFIEETDINTALILEKYQRLSDRFPATYVVMQWMHRTESDIFGRHLSGMEAPDLSDITGPDGITFNGAALADYKPKGQDNANYVAFAIQQPFPNLVWRFDYAMLIDVQGGVLFQPGVRFRPSANWQFDLYATIVEDFTSTKNDTAMESLDFNDEVFARITWFF